MHSERDKMLAGELYDPLDPELVRARERARDLCQDLNATRERDQEARRRIPHRTAPRGRLDSVERVRALMSSFSIPARHHEPAHAS